MLVGCTIKRLPRESVIPAARQAIMLNPVNAPRRDLLFSRRKPTIEEITTLVSTYWGPGGVNLTVGFLDNPIQALRTRILSHMNAWNKRANIKFSETQTNPQVRIARTSGDGYWSYLGTDILHVDSSEPTMNLDSFTMNTEDSEFYRVVRHETGHTLGSPHEHMRAEIIARLDVNKTIRYFMATQGWSRKEVIAQVLTPIEDSDILIGTPHAEEDSIMCYQLPASITKDGKPIVGGTDITDDDYAMMGLIYPKELV